MYSITYGDDLLYDPLDADAYPVSDVSLSAEINGSGSCEFSITKTHPLYDVIDLYDTDRLITVTEDSHILFKGYVASIDEDEYGVRTYSCTGILSFLKKSVVRPYSTDAEDEKHVKAPSTIDGFFNWLISEHDNHTDLRKRFIVGRNEGDIVRRENVIHASRDSASTTADVLQSELLDGLGGYVFVRYGDDGVTYLDYLSECRDTNAQIIDFGVNLVSYSRTDDAMDVATVCYAKGGTPERDEGSDKDKPPVDLTKYPDGPFARGSYRFEKSGDRIICLDLVDKYGYSEMTFEDSDILDPYELLDSAAIALLKQLEPKVTIDIRAIDLSLFMDGYEPLRCGELVRVRSNPNGFDSYMLVSGMDLDLENPENTEYTLGTTFDAFTGESNKIIRQLNATINKSVDQVTALDQTTKDQAIQIGKVENVANDASNKADTANTAANKAQITANTAKDTADNAQTTATAASNTAADAKTTADSANKAADELKKKTAEIDKQVEAVSNAADAASAKADQVRTDLQQQVQNVKSEMDSAVEAAQTSANNAQSAADAAQKAADKANASTADLDKSIKAVDAKAIAAKQAAAEAQSKAENVASDLDSANAVIEQHTTELGELTTKVSNAVTKSDSALSVSTEAKQTATEASTTATSAYTDAQTALTQSTTATQTATAAKTTAESASKTATDSLKQSSAAVQTANQISTTLRTEYQTKADADKIYATQSSLKQTSDSITASVSNTYATKDALSALQNVADNAIESWRGTGVPTLTNKPASDWTTDADKKKHSGDLYYDKSTGKAYRFGSDDGVTYTWELNQDTDVTKALEDAANAQTSANNAQASATAANTAASNAQSTANTAVSNAATAKNAADAAQSSANKAQGDVDKLKIDIPATYATKSSLTQTAESITANVESVKTTANSAVTAASNAQQTADGISANLTKNYQTKSQADTIYATKANLKATSDSISAEVTKAQGTADGAVTAASKAQQTADAVTLNLSKNYQTKAQNDALYATQTSLKATSDSLSANITANANTAQSAVDKATSLEANLNGFKTTVSQTYGHGSNLWVNPTFDADKPQITSLVNNVTAPNGSGVNLLKRRDNLNADTNFPVVPGHMYVITAICKKLIGEKPLHAGIWYTSQTSGHAYDSYVDAESTSNLSDGWISSTWRVTCPDGKSRGCVYFQINQWGNDSSTQWYVSNVTCVDVTGLQPAGDYSTKSYVDQTAKSVALGVVQNYKGSDGSGLATKSDITVAKNSITTTVSETYQTKADMKNYATQSQLTQTNDKVTIAFQNSQSVGGQNLLLRTGVPTVVTGNGGANQCVAFYSLAAGSLKNLPVGMYHMQFKIKSDTAGGTAYAQWDTTPWGLGSNIKVNIGTTEQTYSVDYYITNNNYPNAKRMSVRLDNAKGKVTIREMKLERGNTMTPWTAAPEDAINDLTNAVQNQADALGKTVDSDTFNKYTSDTNNALTHNKNDLDNLSNTISNEIKYREAYIEFGTDMTNPYMDMGTAGNMAKLHLTNTELDFMQDNAKVAWLSNQQLVVNNSTVNDSLTIGNFVFRYRSNGHLTLQHI